MLYCTPFLLFDGNCAEAMTFYKNCLGGELTLTRTGDTPMKDQFPKEKHHKIINAHLKSGNIEFSATDWHADNLSPKQGNTFSIYISGGTYKDLKVIFDLLSEGADKEQRTFIELNNMPFGSYGQLTDKFGVAWIFVGEKQVY
jgi:PhnB protein